MFLGSILSFIHNGTIIAHLVWFRAVLTFNIHGRFPFHRLIIVEKGSSDFLNVLHSNVLLNWHDIRCIFVAHYNGELPTNLQEEVI